MLLLLVRRLVGNLLLVILKVRSPESTLARTRLVRKTMSDWVLVELDPYFARFEGEKAYLNANFLMGGGKSRRIRAGGYSPYAEYVAKRRSFGDAVMSEREFDRLVSR